LRFTPTARRRHRTFVATTPLHLPVLTFTQPFFLGAAASPTIRFEHVPSPSCHNSWTICDGATLYAMGQRRRQAVVLHLPCTRFIARRRGALTQHHHSTYASSTWNADSHLPPGRDAMMPPPTTGPTPLLPTNLRCTAACARIRLISDAHSAHHATTILVLPAAHRLRAAAAARLTHFAFNLFYLAHTFVPVEPRVRTPFIWARAACALRSAMRRACHLPTRGLPGCFREAYCL